jgi:hypothetical protein
MTIKLITAVLLGGTAIFAARQAAPRFRGAVAA